MAGLYCTGGLERESKGEVEKPPLDCGQSPGGWGLRPQCQKYTWQGEIGHKSYTVETVASGPEGLSPLGVTERCSEGGPG